MQLSTKPKYMTLHQKKKRLSLNSAPLLLLRRMGRFLVIGTLGFVTDAGCFILFSNWSIPIYPARLASFSVAVTVTWIFNSRWTFRLKRSTNSSKTFLKYLGSQSMGSLVNLGVFFFGVSSYEVLQAYPPIAIAIASVCAMAFNFIACQLFVFSEEKDAKTIKKSTKKVPAHKSVILKVEPRGREKRIR